MPNETAAIGRGVKRLKKHCFFKAERPARDGRAGIKKELIVAPRMAGKYLLTKHC